MEPIGARMDRRGSAEIVTVTYLTAQHRTLRVSWLDASLTSPGARSVHAHSVAGRMALVVLSGAGTAVISGDAPLGTLWDVAARIQAGTRSAEVRAHTVATATSGWADST
jgi:hypothetical protein